MAENRFRIHTIQSANVIELELPEMLDSQEFDRLNEAILGALHGQAGGKWVIDLTHVAYMGSAMLGLMVNLRQQIKSAGGKLVLCAMPGTLFQIFHTCCMERLFTIVKTRADALRLV
jgi:anti-anti-sigma factor